MFVMVLMSVDFLVLLLLMRVVMVVGLWDVVW